LQTKDVEKIKTHILCPTVFFKKNPALYVMCKNTVSQTGHR